MNTSISERFLLGWVFLALAGGATARAVASPDALPGLALWLRADDGVETDEAGRVAAWRDRSTNGFTLAQTTADWRPALVKDALNGRPAVRFAGWETGGGARTGATPLDCPDFARVRGAGITIATVARDRGVSYLARIVSLGNGAFAMGRMETSGAPDVLFGASNTRIVPARGKLTGAGFVILAVCSDASGTRLFAHGDLLAHGRTPSDAALYGGLVLGAVGNHQDRGGFRGELAELAIYNRVLDDAEMAALTASWRALYRLGEPVTPLASRLPFAYYPSWNTLEVAFDADSALVARCLRDPPRAGLPGLAQTSGLAYAYYEGAWSGTMPDLATAAPAENGVAAELGVARRLAGETQFKFEVNYAVAGRYQEPPPGKKTAFVFDGFVTVPRDGVYNFVLRPHSSARLWIDGEQVAHNLEANSLNWRGGPANLAAGRHRFRLESGGASRLPEIEPALLRVMGPGVALQPIPAAWLSHGGEPSAAVQPAAEGSPPFPPTVPRGAEPETLGVRVFRANDAGRSTVAKGTLKLDGQHRGQGHIELPDLPNGEYAVEYGYRGAVIPGTQPFRRERFPFERNSIGLEHEVLPPFTPVEARRDTVRVIGREYRFNAFGLCDSVVSLGRELLAGPMRIVAETDEGPVEWRPGRARARVLHPDQAEVRAEAVSDALVARTRALVEEDGAARVTLSFAPGKRPRRIERLWVEVPVLDREAPLFHYAVEEAIRLNYGGVTPRGERIEWDFGVPTVWKAVRREEATVSRPDGWLWDSSIAHQYGGPGGRGFRQYVQYIYLGGEERGLAWFGDSDAGHIRLPGRPVQTLTRVDGVLILRTELVQRPTVLTGEHTVTLGFQAAPVKPLPANWRTAEVATGIGPVVCWGGYLCCSKYPDGRDFEIVDKILEPRRTGKVDVEWFGRKNAHRVWPDGKVHGNVDWLKVQLDWFASGQVNATARPGTYFEEHIIFNREPEWQVFQDEWANDEFNRFLPSDQAFASTARSYHDYCVYYAREWNRRGVSLYFDNTFPRRSHNPYNSRAERDGLGGMRYASDIWPRREYYKRIWKTARAETLKGNTLDFTLHMTNTKVLPWSGWTTATLDNEASYRGGETNANGTALPWPPGYVRAVTMSRQSGSVAYTLDPLRNWPDRNTFYGAYRPELILPQLSDWGMQMVHEVRGSAMLQGQALRGEINRFGYGRDDVEVGNYWSEEPLARVDGGDIKWLALRKTEGEDEPGMLLLQSYESAPTTARVAFPPFRGYFDVRTRERFVAAADGTAAIPMDWEYATRLLLAVEDAAQLPPPRPPGAALFDDFEWVAGMEFSVPPSVKRVPCALEPRNHVLRFTTWTSSISPNAPMGRPTVFKEFHLTFRMRLSRVPAGANQNGLLMLLYGRKSDEALYRVILDTNAGSPEEQPTWSFSPIARHGAVPALGAPIVDLTNKGKAWGQAKPVTELGTADNGWHTIELSVRDRRHTLAFDGRTVFEAEAAGPCEGGFSLGPAWRLDGEKLTLDIDDVMMAEE